MECPQQIKNNIWVHWVGGGGGCKLPPRRLIVKLCHLCSENPTQVEVNYISTNILESHDEIGIQLNTMVCLAGVGASKLTKPLYYKCNYKGNFTCIIHLICTHI